GTGTKLGDDWYVATNNDGNLDGLYRSHLGGPWTRLSGQTSANALPEGPVTDVLTLPDPGNPNNYLVFAAVVRPFVDPGSGLGTGVYESSDGGTTWTKITTSTNLPIPEGGTLNLEQTPKTTGRLLLAGAGSRLALSVVDAGRDAQGNIEAGKNTRVFTKN